MVRRLGVAASSASALIFAALLLSNLVVFAASQGRETLYSQSDAGDSLRVNSIALMGAAATNVLIEAQASLASRVLSCSTASQDVSNMIGRLSDVQRSGPVTVTATATAGANAAADDNLSIAAPFNGSLSGDLGVSVRMSVSGNSTGAGVSIHKTEVHLVHLPVRLLLLAGDCVDAVAYLSGAISTTVASNCTSAAVAPLIDRASRVPASTAAADGFIFSLGYAVSAGASCVVSFDVQIQQAGIQGPAGTFSVRAQEGGSASFAQPASQQHR